MTSQVNLEDIYSELNNLLKDVCSFLTNETQNGTLSAKAKNEAEKLVSRSRQQVNIVTNLAVLQESSNSNYPYLEMRGPPGVVLEETLSEYVPAEITDYYEPENYEESYAPVDNEAISLPPPTSTINGDYCLYDDLPLHMIEEKSVKCGPLCRKERYLFIEQKKQYMGGLVGYWLLIYALTKKDQKPLQTINLLNYSARALERKDPTFEIYADNEKNYEFIVRSVKDMEQWVVAINCKKHICTNGRNLPEIPLAANSEENIDSNRTNTTPKTSENIQDVMHYGSEEDIYASVEDFGKSGVAEPLANPVTEDFPKLPPRSNKELLIPPKLTTADTTYNNIQKTENEVIDDDDDMQSEYDIVQCSKIENEKNDEEEELEIYNELKVTETVNKYVRKSSFTNVPQRNYDCVNPSEEELEDYDTEKPISKIPMKVKVFPNNYLVNDEEELPDYDELKPTYLPSKLKQTSNETNVHEDDDLEDYDELKPIEPRQVIPKRTSKDEAVLQEPVKYNKQNKIEEELPNYDVLKPTSFQKNSTPSENKELANVVKLKPITQQKYTSPEQTKNVENNNDTKPLKPIKKFWEKQKKETDSEDLESKINVASIKTKLNAQLQLTPDKNKPLVTLPKPKTQALLNKFPSFSRNRNSKDDDNNSKVQNIRQQLENTFRNHK